jgi:glycosyltransferase involved in cell wall biosynthesis
LSLNDEEKILEKVPLSVAIITKNEEENIRQCLQGVAFAAQIVIVDSGSTDSTLSIAREFGCEIYSEAWRGFGPQKQLAIEKCSQPWILVLDADEWVTPELKKEIIKVVNNPGEYVAFEMPRLSSYCGQYMHHGGWRPDYVTRLCCKGKARFGEEIIHESMIVDGNVGRLSNSIMHESYKDLEDVLTKLNRYSTDGAESLFAAGEKSSLFKAISHGLWSFVYTYIGRAGFLDGRRGFMLAVYNAETTYYKYLKLAMLNEKKIKIAVIVTTYNRPDALKAVLEGYLSQNDKDFELLIADDGSAEETRQLIAGYQEKCSLKIKHVWQEDKGFRAGKIRNMAIAGTGADYIIFSDGDCIPLPDFIGHHRRLAEKNWFVAGSRVLLSERLTNQILKEQTPVHQWKLNDWFAARFKKDINRLSPLLSLPLGNLLRKVAFNKWKGVMTCNLAVWRQDLIKINGFDEAYSGWGLEDSDIVIRLIRSKAYRKSARFLPPVFHLWHKENDRFGLPGNSERFNDLINSDRVYVACGVNQYL